MFKGNVKFHILSEVSFLGKWQSLRNNGACIISSWIDDLTDVLTDVPGISRDPCQGEPERIITEALEADVLIIYPYMLENFEDICVVIGMSLVVGKKVALVVPESFVLPEILRHHPEVGIFSVVEKAIIFYEEQFLRKVNNDKLLQEIPYVRERLQTGAVKFGDDYPGLFLRGDQACELAVTIDDLFSFITEEEQKKIDSFLFIPLKNIRDMIYSQVLLRNLEG